MKDKVKWYRMLYIIGVIALIMGCVDPLEGSVVIAGGSMLLALATYLANDKQRRMFLLSFLFIAVGVIFLFYLSSLGGFGGKSTLSWWWGLLILPYPFGWLVSVVLLITRFVKKKILVQ